MHLHNIPEQSIDYVELVSRKEGLTAQPIQFPARVAIIGAGAAGLTAAFELARVGIEPIAYEASERIGGRLYSYRFPEDPDAIAELGAMRFPPTAATLNQYLKRFDLKTEPFPDPLIVPTMLFVNSEKHLCCNEEELPLPLQRVSKKWADLVERIIAEKKKQVLDRESLRDFWQELVDRYANITFYQALVEDGWDNEEISIFGSLGLGTGGFDSVFNVSFLEILRIVNCRWEKNQALIKGGAEQLAARLWSTRIDCRHFGTTSVREMNQHKWRGQVRSINRDGDQVKVTACSGDSDWFDAAIVTCTLPAIEAGIDIGPGIFSPNVMQAIRRAHYIRSNKVFVRTRTAFWKKEVHSPRCIITDEITRGTYFFDFEGTESGVVCLSYTWEDSSQKFLAMSPEQQVDTCLRTLERVTGSDRIRSQVEEIFTISWEQTPYYHGAFRLASPGQYTDQVILSRQNRVADPVWDSGVYLAGDSVSFSGGWVEGALQTGVQAALSAVNRCLALAG
ncbi:MAG: NAD(P)/FAD-dependent oxidoreductase [Acidobacteriota bacterium]